MKRLTKRAVQAWVAAATSGAAALGLPSIAHAAMAGGGGGLPYEQGLQTFGQSLQGPVAYVIVLICVIAGVGAYLMGSQMEGLLSYVAKAIIGVCIIGGAAAFLTAIGVTGAVI